MQEDLRRPFEQFGPLKDIYLPRDYYTGDPRGFGFIQYVDPADAAEAKHHMEGYLLLGRELTVVFAEENRKKPTEMRTRDRGGRSNRFNDRRRSPPPRRGGRRTRSRSRGYDSPPPKRHQSRSVSPQDRRYVKERSYSRSPPNNVSSVRNGSRGRVNSHSRSRSPRRSLSSRRSRSYTPELARSPVPRQSRSPSPGGERNGDRSPSQ